MSAFPGLGRHEQPTERAIVEAVHEDGTCDCRVPGRPHPYTRLASCSGRFRPHVGQTVVIAFIDHHRTGRRWMPFILGPSSAVMGSGVAQAGRVSHGLSWHNGVAGTPNYTGSLYVMDTGYRPWRLDAGWSIPAPWDGNAIIGYTVDQGYILTVRGRDARCYRAYNGALAWTHELPAEGAKPVYNPARREVVFLRQESTLTHVYIILDAATGAVVGGHTAWRNWAALDLNGIYIWGDWIYDLRPKSGYSGPFPFPFQRYRRDGPSGYTLEGSVTLAHAFAPSDLAGEGLSWRGLAQATPDGLVPYTISNVSGTFLCRMEALPSHEYMTMRIYGGPGYTPPPTLLYDRFEEDSGGWYTFYRNSIGEAHWHYQFKSTAGCMGLLDLGTGASAVKDAVQPPPFGEPEKHAHPTIWMDIRSHTTDFLYPRPDTDFPPYGVNQYFDVKEGLSLSGLMAADGGFYGKTYTMVYTDSYLEDSSDTARSWTATGGLRSSSEVLGSRYAPASGDRVVMYSDRWHVARPDGSIMWSLPSGASFTGHGGETVTGDNAWVLVLVAGGGSYQFRDFNSGALLGAWAGNRPVMVSAGVIYDDGGPDGSLRRWIA